MRWGSGSRPSSQPCVDGPALSLEETFRTGCQAGRSGGGGVGAGMKGTGLGGVFIFSPGEELHVERDEEHVLGSQTG